MTDLVIEVEDVPNPPKYAISNFGRIRSFQKPGAGDFIKGSVIQGYRSLNVRLPKGRSFSRYIHKVVAETFLKKPLDKHIFVIHLDYDKQNNHFENLKFVTRSEMAEHKCSNPNGITHTLLNRIRSGENWDMSKSIMSNLFVVFCLTL